MVDNLELITTHGTFSLADQPEMFPALPALAERLGIKPNTTNSGTLLVMKNGDKYDLFALVNALLDRLDQATPRPRE